MPGIRGRKSHLDDNVVPLKGDVHDPEVDARFEEVAREAADRLKPKGLPQDVSVIWDRLAWTVCHPRRRRITDPATAHSFAMVCYALADFHKHDKFIQQHGIQYSAETRNGLQYKKWPAFTARKEAWEQAWRGMLEFGMTPASAQRILDEASQPDMFGDNDEQQSDFA